MPQSPPTGMPQCCPYLFYEELAKTTSFLEQAFGFTRRFSHTNPKGELEHVQLAYGTGVIMLGSAKQPGLLTVKTPRVAGSLNAAVYLFVESVDEHHARAREAGAEILLKPGDMPWGDRVYCAVDPEGQFWTFATPLR